MTQLTTKHAKELLDILEDTKETMFKDHKTDHPLHPMETQTHPNQRKTNQTPPIHPPSNPNHNRRKTKTRTKTQTRPRKESQPLLTIRLLNKSNRTTEELLSYFHLIIGEEINYKYIKRLYNDPEIRLALHNVFVLLLKDEGALSGDLSGDGTGYAVSVENHYRTGPQKHGKKLFTSLRCLISRRGCMWGVGCQLSQRWRLSKRCWLC